MKAYNNFLTLNVNVTLVLECLDYSYTGNSLTSILTFSYIFLSTQYNYKQYRARKSWEVNESRRVTIDILATFDILRPPYV